ncbi:MAG: type II secretion system F family protein [Actinomycetota bacterium]|nr:type II secretion system F family protein [Actinomycetota bacterium]
MTPALLTTVGVVSGFGAAALLIFAIQDYVLDRRRVYRSLRNVRDIELRDGVHLRQKELAAPLSQRVLVPVMRALAQLGRRVTPASLIERLEQELQHAGSPASWDAERILAFKVLLAAGLPIAVVVAGPLLALGFLQVVVFAAVFALVGYYLPEWILRAKAGERQDKIRRALPDSLDLLSVTVEAGLGFDAALDRVAREVAGPLGGELHRVVQEIQLGRKRSDALRGLADRNSVDELKSFVLAMIQADVLGISVSNVLKTQADQMRVKRRQRAEERAQKLPVKILFPLLFCIFPALFVVLLGPAVIRISETVLRVF